MLCYQLSHQQPSLSLVLPGVQQSWGLTGEDRAGSAKLGSAPERVPLLPHLHLNPHRVKPFEAGASQTLSLIIFH